ncbi:hypothetical protein Y032_0141g2217 [Ancylostoma ceylanicum]|uniref:Protein kinase domain-containing protein n=1 Tax=Ancylostoma ceylanicum TaxID=53326 RepID=A0A016T3N5_9BILA|nr:hypothetical protein Y032_0141g2217 [Ancylostoma ceylanicum]
MPATGNYYLTIKKTMACYHSDDSSTSGTVQSLNQCLLSNRRLYCRTHDDNGVRRMDKIPLKEVPEKIIDKEHGITYIRGKFLGKGGFARCYELTNSSTNEVFAGKIVSKTLLIKPYQREKMTQEVQIHRSLSHPHVVQLYSFFEDADNVYITLELCPRRSLMELHKRRRAVTEPEARFFTHQVCLAVDYLHDKKVIHRDLKLGNLFLNGELQVKIGDFGLATTVDIEGERKKTLCGTPNYIAPEVLDKKGHSFEVDIWAIGCILYTLLFGRPPFETKSLKETYSRIKMNQYRVPSTASQTAAHLIQNLLAADPAKRPTVKQGITALLPTILDKKLALLEKLVI